MKSTITLFYKSLVNKEKNFVLDDGNGESRLENYLSTLQKVVINDFQYIKIQLSLSIKIDMNQTNLEMIETKDLNYIKIQNGNERSYYYFVISKTWRSKETIELVLSMDTLNCFKFNEDYVINDKTLTKRMHKDRFEKHSTIIKVIFDYTQASDISFEGLTENTLLPYEVEFRNDGQVVKIIECDGIYKPSNQIIELTNVSQEDAEWIENYSSEYFDDITIFDSNNYVAEFLGVPRGVFSFEYSYSNIRKIDLKSEDISCPVYKTKDDLLQESSFIVEWALYYKNRTSGDNQPVDCYLTATQPIKFKTPSATRYIDVNNIPSGKIILITPTYQGNLSFKINDTTYTLYSEYWDDIYEHGITYYCIGFMNFNGTLRVYKYTFSRDFAYTSIGKVFEQSIDNAVVEFTGSQDSIVGYETDSVTSYTGSFPTPNFTFTFSGSTTITLFTKDTIDKTLSENLKIINIPYCPSEAVFDGDIVALPPLWTYDATYHYLRLTDLNARFSHLVTTSVANILDYFETSFVVNLSQHRTIKDSKLYHSDYFRPKFVYDSFSRIFPLEQMNYKMSLRNNPTDNFQFTFVMSRNIVSKFMFKFDFVYNHSNEDYPNVVAVARNNEEVLYNSSYLNYIRTGYNYDLKAKERQETAGAIGLGLNIAGLIASIGVSFIPGGQAIGIGGAIASGLGLVGQMVNYAKTTAQNEENIQRKLAETQRQAVSVLNADDYDLLYEYSSNKAKLCLYEVSENMKNVLDDLFYYGGYLVNEQMIPNISSRYWFNFVQASLVINDSSNLTSEIEDDIKEKFEQGVTFLHYHNKFDFKQEMENWETSLLE